MPAAAILLVLAQVAPTPTAPHTATGNATADLIVEKSLALGIDFAAEPGKTRATSENLQALSKAAPRSWLDAQVQIPDDSITEPPMALHDFLDERREPLWTIVAALEKGPPEWKVKSWEEEIPRLLPWVHLHKILLATALAEERVGNRIEAERALEASWSLGRAFAVQKTLIARMISVSVERWQAGVLRKFPDPPPSWADRLSNPEPWKMLAEALTAEGRLSVPGIPSPEIDAVFAVQREAMQAVAEALPKISPCDRESLSDDALWRRAAVVFQHHTSDEAKAMEPFVRDMIQGNVASMIRRTARLRVDQELSSRILELRLERAASRDRKWPEKTEITSAVCPGVTYRYRIDGERMEIRFEGSVDTPEAGVVLPLEYATLDSPPAEAR
ncbi:MAG: hypothetical protein WAU32_16645 [Thermoanaerobaculia bacterium]